MNKEIKQCLSIWEEEQIKELEKKASESEHIFSKEFERKLDIVSVQEKDKKKKKFIRKAAIIAAASFLIFICRFSDVQSLAAGWLEEFLHLQIDVIQEDNAIGKEIYIQEKITAGMEKKEAASDEMQVEFYTLINMTEREYWNYLKENELSAEKEPKYLPDGYILDKSNNNTEYRYVYEEKAEDEFDDTKVLSEVFPETGFFGVDKKKPLKSGKNIIKMNGRDAALILREICKTWKKGKSELCYYERIHDWTKRIIFDHIISCEKILIGERDAYVLKEKDRVHIVFYQKSSRIIFSGTGEDQESIYQELVKMAESLPKQ